MESKIGNGIPIYHQFVAVHKAQLLLSGVPEHFWPVLCKKLYAQTFDAGISFQLALIDYEDSEKSSFDPIWTALATTDINRNDSNHIYLIDHAWTFEPNSIKANLRRYQQLLERMCNIMQIKQNTTEEKIEHVCINIWKFANTYAIDGTVVSVEDRLPVWYVMDELGSAINHSDEPNFRAVPFMFVPQNMMYTLLYPLENVQEGSPITRNFVEGHYPPLQREAMLIPWRGYENLFEDYTQTEPDANYFIEGHIVETLPVLDSIQVNKQSTKLKVYSEYMLINENLTLDQFEIVDNEDEADILWYFSHFKNFQKLSEESPHKLVNQFPFEYVITVKDLLAVVSRRCSSKENLTDEELTTHPLWLPTTFNLKNELPNLVSYYMRRKKAGLDNYWICKPYNLARGLDTFITDNLDFLCCLPLTQTPKIAQKYIENPVLFDRPDVGKVKFDIRYVVLLKSVDPTTVYIYNNFFLRFANKPFAMDNFEDYEQHFTVMNYVEEVPLHRMLCDEFKQAWAEQYKSFPWGEIEKKIFSMFNELFTAASSKPPPCGIAKSPQSRALYAADIMLSWHKYDDVEQIIPKLLEMNWMPDCQRACEYYPDFYNDIFSLLFLDKDVDSCSKVM